MAIRFRFLVLVSAVLRVRSLPTDDVFNRALPATWYHDESSAVRQLFTRDGASTLAPGSPEWKTSYPPLQNPIAESTIPQAWLSALQAAEQAGLIPNITVPAVVPNNNPQYAPGDNPAGSQICSSTWKCKMPDDIWDAPDGMVAISFDDGPTYGSPTLYPFLQQNNIRATHFMIGSNIRDNFDLFNQAYNTLQGDIAVHTWTHPYMTTLNNTQLVAQFGWTMQIIYDLTGGRVPRFWRPPFGDSDNRVRAISKHVFNLTQVNWNSDSGDWTIDSGKENLTTVETAIKAFYQGPKSPGLIILEHELTTQTAQAFIDTYPLISQNGWKNQSLAVLNGGAYQNAASNNGPVSSMPFVSSPTTLSSASPTVAPVTAALQGGATTTAGSSISSPSHKPAGNVGLKTTINTNLFILFTGYLLIFGF